MVLQVYVFIIMYVCISTMNLVKLTIITIIFTLYTLRVRVIWKLLAQASCFCSAVYHFMQGQFQNDPLVFTVP